MLQSGFGSHARSLVWFLVIVVAFTGVLFFFYRVKRQLRPAEYEGKVVDKWVGYSQTETGSDPYFRLLVEADGGQRSTVAVDQETFERVKVGMRIKKTQSGIELSRSVVPSSVDSRSLRKELFS